MNRKIHDFKYSIPLFVFNFHDQNYDREKDEGTYLGEGNREKTKGGLLLYSNKSCLYERVKSIYVCVCVCVFLSLTLSIQIYNKRWLNFCTIIVFIWLILYLYNNCVVAMNRTEQIINCTVILLTRGRFCTSLFEGVSAPRFSFGMILFFYVST